MKVSIFNRGVARSYIESSPVIIEKGIAYYKSLNPTVSDEVARECAIQDAVDKCERMWNYDSTGYISNERIAYIELCKEVENHRYFYTKEMEKKEKAAKKAEEEEQIEREKRLKEYERVKKLRSYCTEHNLDFAEENKKQLKKLYIRNNISFTIQLMSFIIGIVVGALFVWHLSKWNQPQCLYYFIATFACFVVFLIGTALYPGLPDDAYDPIKKKK